MPDLSRFAVTQKWPARYPERLQLYSLPTPNGVKVSIMLEECCLPDEPHLVSFETQDQFSPEFIASFPNNKIPAIIDPNGPAGQALALFESGAILLYLADRDWGMGDDHSIADMAIFPWVRSLIERYQAGALGGILDFPHVTRALTTFATRPAVVRGLAVPVKT